jgi:hypothetical protein
MQPGLLIEKADPINTISNFNRTLKVNVIYLGVEHMDTLFGKYLLLHLTFNFLYQISKCQGRCGKIAYDRCQQCLCVPEALHILPNLNLIC